MEFESIFSSEKLQNQTLDPIILSQDQIIETEVNLTKPIIDELNSSILMFMLWMTVFSIISMVLVKILPKLEHVKFKDLSILPLSQVPCRNCIFFAQKNQYLKCAVHPCTVLTKQAIDCSDYLNKDESSLRADYQSQSKATVNNQDESSNYS